MQLCTDGLAAVSFISNSCLRLHGMGQTDLSHAIKTKIDTNACCTKSSCSFESWSFSFLRHRCNVSACPFSVHVTFRGTSSRLGTAQLTQDQVQEGRRWVMVVVDMSPWHTLVLTDWFCMSGCMTRLGTGYMENSAIQVEQRSPDQELISAVDLPGKLSHSTNRRLTILIFPLLYILKRGLM